MKAINEEHLVVVYTGDETQDRKKMYGATIMDQMLKSVKSLRKNWSTKVEVVFIHTEPLSKEAQKDLKRYNVNVINAKKKICAEFPIANKILVGFAYQGKKDILFLDCDTIIHQNLNFDTSVDILVCFDALQDVSEMYYRKLYSALNVEFPTGRFSEKPSFEYYYMDNTDLFPLLNTGVYFIKNKHKDKFYKRLEENFNKTYRLLRHDLSFYFDQICFALTIKQMALDFKYFPKGYNFICTSRAPYLKDWPRNEIIIEHYAGNNARPLVFNGNKIDLEKSSIL